MRHAVDWPGARSGRRRALAKAVNVAAEDATPEQHRRLAIYRERAKAGSGRSATGDAGLIRAALGARKSELAACYAGGLARNPTLRGRVVVRLVVEKSGAVTEASDAGSELPDAEMVGCVIAVFRTLRLAPPKGGARRIRYPIRFEPKSAKGGEIPPKASRSRSP